ncbi:hypothetical protein ACLK17_27195 [Escherichia coli]
MEKVSRSLASLAFCPGDDFRFYMLARTGEASRYGLANLLMGLFPAAAW